MYHTKFVILLSGVDLRPLQKHTVVGKARVRVREELRGTHNIKYIATSNEPFVVVVTYKRETTQRVHVATNEPEQDGSTIFTRSDGSVELSREVTGIRRPFTGKDAKFNLPIPPG